MADETKYELLFDVNDPEDIRDFDVHKLKQLSSEIREYLVDVISQIGGHFGGGLGAVELTIEYFPVSDRKVFFQDKYPMYLLGYKIHERQILKNSKEDRLVNKVAPLDFAELFIEGRNYESWI